MDVPERSNFPENRPENARDCVVPDQPYLLRAHFRGGGATPKACARSAAGELAVRRIAVYDDSAKDLDLMPKPAVRAPESGPTSLSEAGPDGVEWSATGSAPDPARLAGDDERKRNGGGDRGNPSTAVITKTKPQTKRPNLYRVLLLNDDYTPMEFVVHVLERFFNKDREAATRIMLHVHHHGIGECGIYTYEVAETKVTQVMDFARKHQHPLQCVMEKK
jgi:ATP-dependent Clp protease adaptor protein ClpS